MPYFLLRDSRALDLQHLTSYSARWWQLWWLLLGLPTSNSGVRAFPILKSRNNWRHQTDFQNAKKEYQKTAKVPAGYKRADLDRGFRTTGLFNYSRHPNFAAEQAIWVSLWLWSCNITQTFYSWTVVGPIAYLILFQASTLFTESITSGKYPEYANYQKAVGMFIPRLGATWANASDSIKAAGPKELKKHWEAGAWNPGAKKSCWRYDCHHILRSIHIAQS